MELFNPDLSSIAANLTATREKRGKNVKNCADALGITSSRYKKYESGETLPTLPELESLSYFLNVPLTELVHTRENRASSDVVNPDGENLLHLIEIRDSVIGTLLQIEREKNELTLKLLASRCSIPVSRLKRWESGQNGIPMDDLLKLTQELNIQLAAFLDVNSPIGLWQQQQQQITAFLNLPEEMQAFVSNPDNIPYLSLANRMKEIQPEDLENISQAFQLLVEKLSDETQTADSQPVE
ncbi:MAG: Xre family DNA-binding protein [Anaerolinea thermophila]|uniref:Xre family DNA-binding protein n=1 Tax=Anaerolinea thermophila TaxID=167964 RepID=A0A117LGU6_9CHLR|nr:MAG: Xre family DNA-binding protein [Anaerolinea thermophila]